MVEQTTEDEFDFQAHIEAARAGSDEALNKLFAQFRPYLLFIANRQLDPGLRAKLGASDVVQETLCSAQAAIDDFRGETIDEWMAWLRKILENDLLEVRRRYRETGKRQLDRELELDADSRMAGAAQAPGDYPTPGTEAIAREEAEALQAALARLPADYAEVIRLRNWEELSFADIGQRMGRTAEAVRKLWYRAVLRLQSELETDE